MFACVFLQPPLHALACEVLVAAVDCLELAAINRHQRGRKQLKLPAHAHKLRAHAPDRLAVIFAKIGNRLEVRHQPPGQPDQLHVAMAFSLQPPARLDTVQITVHIDLQQRRRLIARPPRDTRLRAREA